MRYLLWLINEREPENAEFEKTEIFLNGAFYIWQCACVLISVGLIAAAFLSGCGLGRISLAIYASFFIVFAPGVFKKTFKYLKYKPKHEHRERHGVQLFIYAFLEYWPGMIAIALSFSISSLNTEIALFFKILRTVVAVFSIYFCILHTFSEL